MAPSQGSPGSEPAGFQSVVYTVVGVACWAGAAAHQAAARVTLQKTAHLNAELRALLHSYFCDLASVDTMLTDMLVRGTIGAAGGGAITPMWGECISRGSLVHEEGNMKWKII